MNLADLCPRGRDLYAEWQRWRQSIGLVMRASPQWANTISLQRCAFKAYRAHVDECATCKEE